MKTTQHLYSVYPRNWCTCGRSRLNTVVCYHTVLYPSCLHGHRTVDGSQSARTLHAHDAAILCSIRWLAHGAIVVPFILLRHITAGLQLHGRIEFHVLPCTNALHVRANLPCNMTSHGSTVVAPSCTMVCHFAWEVWCDELIIEGIVELIRRQQTPVGNSSIKCDCWFHTPALKTQT